MDVLRIARHLVVPDWWAHRAFSGDTLMRIEQALRESESLHRGELRFVVEGDLHLSALLRGMTARQRAEELFAQLRVWDTEENTGALIYVQLIDRDIEIVADRGINAKVSQAEWGAICADMQSEFLGGRYLRGSLKGIASITALLEQYFPSGTENPDELPNRPLQI